MKAAVLIIFLVALAATVQSQAIDLAEAEMGAAGVAASYAAGAGREEMCVHVVGAARQNICTALLCHNVCISLGFRTGSCNWRLECVCRR